MRLSIALAVTLAFAQPSPTSAAASPRESLVVTTGWLAQHLKDPDLVLLHVGDKAEYEAGHIPGARLIETSAISVSDTAGTGNGLRLEMLPADVLREKLAGFGISDQSRIVVYFGKDWLTPSTRVMFTLDYAGLGERTSLLEGGQPAWVRAGEAVTSVVPDPKPGTLSPLKIRPIVVTSDFVKDLASSNGHVLIDARATGFYDGSQPGGRPDAPKFGHLPGAASLPFSETTDESLVLRSSEDLAARFAKAGAKPGDTIVGYCHIGQQATAMLFAARTLGFKVLLYDGSFEDWAKHPDYPIVK